MSRPILFVMMAGAAGSFALSALLTWMVRRAALRIGFVDRPGGHKAHLVPVPLGGGVAIFASLVLPLLAAILVGTLARIWLPDEILERILPLGTRTARLVDLLDGVAVKGPSALAILGGAVVLHVLGLIDDARALGPGIKMFVMLAVSLTLTAGFGIRSLDVLGPVPASLLSCLWIVLITNAFNFMDNMDGLSAGVAAIAALVFAAAALIAGQLFVPGLAVMLAGAVLGFLVFNFPPARIFMGDSGSLVVGYFMAILTILTTYYNPQQQGTPFGLLAPLVVLAVPLYDVISVVVARIRVGVSPFRGDRRHFSHRLVRRGMQPRSAVLTIYLATAATGCSALILPFLTWPLAILVGLQCFCVVLIVAILESPGRLTSEEP